MMLTIYYNPIKLALKIVLMQGSKPFIAEPYNLYDEVRNGVDNAAVGDFQCLLSKTL